METAEAIQARHRKEQRDLQARVTNKKKNATKKTRKGVNDECAELERQLRERQEQELAAALNGGGNAEEQGGKGESEQQSNGVRQQEDGLGDDAELSTRLKDTNLASESQSQPSPPPSQQQEQQGGGGGGGAGKKRNRQKERLARRAAEVEAAAEAAEAEAANMTDHRGIEKTRLAETFAENGLVEREIRPDGHCLFAAVADQLSERGVDLLSSSSSSSTTTTNGSQLQTQTQTQTQTPPPPPPYKIVRRRAADYMETHADDFAPFLEAEEPLERHAARIRDTAEWGGQLELAALASAYGVEIRVVQGDGRRTETIEPSSSSSPSPSSGGGDRQTIWLAYYRHGYGLGEHYNSLRSKKKEEEAAAAS